VICAFIIFLFYISIVLVNIIYDANELQDVIPTALTEIRRNKIYNIYLYCAKTLFYFITSILSLIERNKILCEVRHSPYSNIDETLTESLYKNIIEQSKNPGDKSLREAYKRMTINSKININTINSTSSNILNNTNNQA